MKELDNIKMLEFMAEKFNEDTEFGLAIRDALKNQGFEFKDNKIMPITTSSQKPKFKSGDWIVHQGTENIYQVLAIIDNQYQLRYGDTYTVQKCADVDRCARLWDVAKDAKDGDVLVSSSGKPFIFNGFFDNDPMAYGGLVADDSFWPASNSNWTTVYCKPATKEQRDLLFQKMREAGYKWDAEKKELKKIEQKPVIEMKTPEESLGVGSDTYNKIVGECVYGEQNTAWSEVDEVGLANVMWAIKQARTIAKDENDMGNLWYAERWLIALKERVQPKQEWSEEDEEKINEIIDYLDYKGHKTDAEFLKSLRPQSTWKPSDEQLTQLSNASNGLYYNCETLLSLLEQLTKLKE